MSNTTWPPPPPITSIGEVTTSNPTTVKLLFFSITYPTLFTETERDTLSKSALSYEVARLGNAPGVDTASSFREALERVLDLAPGESLTPQMILNKYMPLFIFAGCVFLAGLVVLGLSIWMCCRLSPRVTSCGKPGKRGKIAKPNGWNPKAWDWPTSWNPTKWHSGWLPLLLSLLLLAFLIWGIVDIFWGTLQLGKELSNAVTAVNEILLLVNFKIAMIPKAIAVTAINVNATLVAAVNKGGEILNESPALDKLDAVQARLRQALLGINQVDLIPTLVTDLNNIAAKLDVVEQKIYNGINKINDVNILENFPFQILPEFQIPNIDPNRTGYVAKAAADLNAALADSNSKLNAAMAKVDNVTNAIINKNITESWSEIVQDSAKQLVDTVGGATQAAVDKSIAAYEKTLGKVIDTMSQAQTQFVNIIRILNYLEVPRNVLTIIMETFVILFIIAAIVAIVLRQPELLANFAMAAAAIAVISFIASGVYLVVAALLNESCYYMAQNRWEVLLPTINNLGNLNISVDDITPLLDARRACSDGVSPIAVIIQTLAKLGIANDVDIKDILGFLNNTIDGLGPSVAAIKESVQASIEKAGDVIDDKAAVAAREVREAAQTMRDVQEKYIDGLLTALETPNDYARLKQKVDDLIAAGQAAINLDKVPDFIKNQALDVIIKQAQNLKELIKEAAANIDERVRLDNLLYNTTKRIDNVFDNNIARLENLANELDTLAATLREVTESVADRIVERVANLSINGTNGMLDLGGNIISELVGCHWVVQDTFIAQYALCVGVAKSTDALWFGLFLQGMALTLLIPCLMWLAKRIWGVDPLKWSWRGDVEKEAASLDASVSSMEADGKPIDAKPVDSKDSVYAAANVDSEMLKKDAEFMKMEEMKMKEEVKLETPVYATQAVYASDAVLEPVEMVQKL
jgi:hypothetical protein